MVREIFRFMYASQDPSLGPYPDRMKVSKSGRESKRYVKACSFANKQVRFGKTKQISECGGIFQEPPQFMGFPFEDIMLACGKRTVRRLDSSPPHSVAT